MKAALEDALFAGAGRVGYAVLDGANWAGLPGFLAGIEATFTPVPAGALDPGIAEVAPYLVKLEEDETVFDTLFAAAWGRSRGVFTVSGEDMEDVRAHLRRISYVMLEGRGLALFRYYDPRVLAAFGPIATREQRAVLTGGVLDGFFYEAEGGDALRVLSAPSNADATPVAGF